MDRKNFSRTVAKSDHGVSKEVLMVDGGRRNDSNLSDINLVDVSGLG
jgi:hypothetical protein